MRAGRDGFAGGARRQSLLTHLQGSLLKHGEHVHGRTELPGTPGISCGAGVQVTDRFFRTIVMVIYSKCQRACNSIVHFRRFNGRLLCD